MRYVVIIEKGRQLRCLCPRPPGCVAVSKRLNVSVRVVRVERKTPNVSAKINANLLVEAIDRYIASGCCLLRSQRAASRSRHRAAVNSVTGQETRWTRRSWRTLAMQLQPSSSFDADEGRPAPIGVSLP